MRRWLNRQSLLVSLFTVLGPALATAQRGGHFGLEGYVLHRDTGLPVRGATVVMHSKTEGTATTTTDANGFYIFDLPIPSSQSYSKVSAQCRLPVVPSDVKGGKNPVPVPVPAPVPVKTVGSSIPLYTELREGQIYRRDLYLPLGQNTSCGLTAVAGGGSPGVPGGNAGGVSVCTVSPQLCTPGPNPTPKPPKGAAGNPIFQSPAPAPDNPIYGSPAPPKRKN